MTVRDAAPTLMTVRGQPGLLYTATGCAFIAGRA